MSCVFTTYHSQQLGVVPDWVAAGAEGWHALVGETCVATVVDGFNDTELVVGFELRVEVIVALVGPALVVIIVCPGVDSGTAGTIDVEA